jgi:DNA-binding HxlR family transcriptional regulator
MTLSDALDSLERSLELIERICEVDVTQQFVQQKQHEDVMRHLSDAVKRIGKSKSRVNEASQRILKRLRQEEKDRTSTLPSFPDGQTGIAVEYTTNSTLAANFFDRHLRSW